MQKIDREELEELMNKIVFAYTNGYKTKETLIEIIEMILDKQDELVDKINELEVK